MRLEHCGTIDNNIVVTARQGCDKYQDISVTAPPTGKAFVDGRIYQGGNEERSL